MGAAGGTSPGVRGEPANLENLAVQLEKGEAHGDWLIVARDRKSRSNKEKDYTLSYNNNTRCGISRSKERRNSGKSVQFSTNRLTSEGNACAAFMAKLGARESTQLMI
ncbi:hypothetical protein NC652_014928 [Populus alba x Populus x berolinensis]|uniref:Uncharacterized protein n=1 Tax=Populus alba x Populus x berolinensis TaxID=444605 RepID=A0AAD6QZ81_9ROSI|nr:hypothetical protein NC652_014928 [Populus alba x Populus x berolinensis]KAJ6998855.1 hypothetical protein NC653_014877 [Populus alba x Populus x berolinensis]